MSNKPPHISLPTRTHTRILATTLLVDPLKDRTSLREAIEVTSMMVSGRAVATALCALGTTSAFTAPPAGFRAVSEVYEMTGSTHCCQPIYLVQL